MGKTVKCPACGSLNFQAVANSKKALSLSKGAAGVILFGPIGAAGAALGTKGKTTFVCNDCGNSWKMKL